MSVAEITETTQYLTYKPADEVFALDIGKVREVLDFTDVTLRGRGVSAGLPSGRVIIYCAQSGPKMGLQTFS